MREKKYSEEELSMIRQVQEELREEAREKQEELLKLKKEALEGNIFRYPWWEYIGGPKPIPKRDSTKGPEVLTSVEDSTKE